MVARPLNATPSASPSQPAERLSQRVGEGRLSGIFGAGGMAIQGDPLMALLGPLNGAGSLNELLQGAQRHSDPAAPTRNTQSLEHIRQSILTLHSLRASMPPTVFMPPGFSNDSTADVGGAVESPPKVFYLGQWIDVKDTVNQWLEATVMNVDLRERKVFVHYNGWYGIFQYYELAIQTFFMAGQLIGTSG